MMPRTQLELAQGESDTDSNIHGIKASVLCTHPASSLTLRNEVPYSSDSSCYREHSITSPYYD